MAIATVIWEGVVRVSGQSLVQPGEGFCVALAFEIVAEIGVAIGWQSGNEGVEVGCGFFECGEVGGRVAIPECVVGDDV